MTSKYEMSEEEANRRRAAGAKALNAAWKQMTPAMDYTPKTSYSQELMGFIPPAEGSIPVHYRLQKTDFSEYLNKAVQLKVNLKSTAH